MQITANHKQPGDNTPCTACSRVRTETYVLTLGNVTVCVCDQCWPRMLERVAALGVSRTVLRQTVVIGNKEIKAAVQAVEEAEESLRSADYDLSTAKMKLEELATA
jgi:hypothetical protein